LELVFKFLCVLEFSSFEMFSFGFSSFMQNAAVASDKTRRFFVQPVSLFGKK